MSVVASSAARIGRFRLLRPLGQGAQGIVYAAHDPELDRQVAIKTLRLNAASAHAEQLLATARTASSLSHPNVVPVFEVGLDAGQPFVVFEYVEGTTLAEVLRAEGALPMARAVVMMSQILAGIAHVHANGLLHGDIKPANILIGASGIPRVTDFGISRRAVKAAGESVRCGTVQYTAPECLSDHPADYRSDVFALGLLFHEMLTGKPVFDGGNDYSTIYRILNEPPAPPSVLNPRIDRRLDDIVLKALERDPSRRYADAEAMKRDLDRYRVPSATPGDCELREQPLHATVEFLLRRMAFKSDFPALTASFNRINQLAADGAEASLKAISDLVIRDFALTQKLLRVVNAAGFGAGKVTRVSEAITLLGLAQLRAVATGMMLAGGAASAARAPEVASALTDAFVAGVIARNAGRMLGLKTVEELFICGMFSRLGELLTLFYLADEHEAVRQRVVERGIDSAAASRAVLGLSFDELGAEVARHWKFPEVIVQALRPLPRGNVPPPADGDEAMQVCAGYARDLCTLMRETPPAERERVLALHERRFAAAVPVSTAQLRLLIGHSITAALQYMKASGLQQVETALLAAMRALATPPEPAGNEAASAAAAAAADPDTPASPSHDAPAGDTTPAVLAPAAPAARAETRAPGMAARLLEACRRVLLRV